MDKPLGQIAYEAYCQTTDNKSLASGVELPPWEGLNEAMQNAWTQAALVVHEHIRVNETVRFV